MVLVFTIIPLVLVSSPPHNHHHQEALTASKPLRLALKEQNMKLMPNSKLNVFIV